MAQSEVRGGDAGESNPAQCGCDSSVLPGAGTNYIPGAAPSRARPRPGTARSARSGSASRAPEPLGSSSLHHRRELGAFSSVSGPPCFSLRPRQRRDWRRRPTKLPQDRNGLCSFKQRRQRHGQLARVLAECARWELEAWLAGSSLAQTPRPAPPPFFFNHSCARVGEKRTGRETGQRAGTGSLLWKEPPGTQIHQSVMTIPNPAHPPPRRSQSEVPRQKADWVGGEKQFSQYQKEERSTSANHFWTYRVFLRRCSLPWALIGSRVRAFAADC
ncbi:uncharacterized protein LOC122429065 [Cervus canadensis]|uniref:uncharacterized protein LOC122429065 n=1 Tax=Cervus canadensis TaxID=1574408 RepID=UPI001C9E8F7D|nr:uncharacterized protein LOC122429065 [Cervus canadensis]